MTQHDIADAASEAFHMLQQVSKGQQAPGSAEDLRGGERLQYSHAQDSSAVQPCARQLCSTLQLCSQEALGMLAESFYICLNGTRHRPAIDDRAVLLSAGAESTYTLHTQSAAFLSFQHH